MTGFQLVARVSRSAELLPQPCGPPSFSNSSRLRNWRCRTSAPVEKARPLPLRIATSASSSRSKRRSAFASCTTTSSLTALSLSGRLIVIVAMRSAEAYSTKFGSSMVGFLRGLPTRPAFKAIQTQCRPMLKLSFCSLKLLKEVSVRSHRPIPLGLAQRCTGLSEAAQERRWRPAIAIALVPSRDLVVNLAHPDRVGPVHQPTAVARKAEPMQPHHIDIAGAQRLP